MPEVIQFGPFMIRLSWLILGISGVSAFYLVQYKFKRSDEKEKPLLDKFSNAVFIIFLVWKLSPLIHNPILLWESPIAILLLPGTEMGLWIGLAVAAWYMHRALLKLRISHLFFADLLSLGIVTFFMVRSVLGWQYGRVTQLPWGISIENPEFAYHPINVYLLVISIPMFIWLWHRIQSQLGSGKLLQNFLIYFGMGLMLVSFFKQTTDWLFGLSMEQVVYFAMMIIGFIYLPLFNQWETTNERKKSHESDLI